MNSGRRCLCPICILYVWAIFMVFSLMSSLQTSQWQKISSSAGVMSFTCVYGLLYKMVWTCRHSCFQCYINQGENRRGLTATETLSRPLIRECQPLWQCLLVLISLLILTNTIGKHGVITSNLELFSHAMGNITPIIYLIGQMENHENHCSICLCRNCTQQIWYNRTQYSISHFYIRMSHDVHLCC